jgi:hypothetical protein
MKQYLGIAKKEIPSLTSAWKSLKHIILSKTNQAQKDKYQMMTLILKSVIEIVKNGYY